MSKFVEANEKIAEGVVKGYKKIEDKFTETFLNEDGTMKTAKIGDAVVKGYKKIEDGVVEGYKKIETGVVDGYKKIETGVVEGFGKITNKCAEMLCSKESESAEENKE